MTEPSLDLALNAARAADAKGATDIVVLHVGPVVAICEYFVVVSASNDRQVRAVVDSVEEAIRLDRDESPRSVEGADARRWVLLDYGDVVIHVFHRDEREYYRLERLYRDAEAVAWPADGQRSAG